MTSDSTYRLRGGDAHDGRVGDCYGGDLQAEVNQGVDSNLDGDCEADCRVNPVSAAAYDAEQCRHYYPEH